MVQNRLNFAFATGGIATVIPIRDKRISLNGHQALWVVFDSWARDPRSTTFCGEQIGVAGSSLADWVDGRTIATPLLSVMPSLLKNWGLDLERFGGDRELRNHLSYDPTRIEQKKASLSPSEIESLVSQIWSLMEPQRLNPFENLDTYLARQALEGLHKASNPSVPTRSASYRSLNRTMAANVLGSGRGEYFMDFLQRPFAEPDPEIVRLASVDPSSSLSLDEKLKGMTGRALILLRFAIASMRDLMFVTGVSANDADFWIRDLLSERAIPIPTSMPADYSDMYGDIRNRLVNIQELQKFRFVNDLPIISERFAGDMVELCGFERVAAWSIA
jgi:hypothetical protein